MEEDKEPHHIAGDEQGVEDIGDQACKKTQDRAGPSGLIGCKYGICIAHGFDL
jgi:hypothetical protein